jgi:RNA polymerase sigma-70 factor (ECF subfamily)
MTVPLPKPSPRLRAEPPAQARLAALYCDHYDFVRRLVRRLGGQRIDVDDAVQEIFIVAFRRIDDYDEHACHVTTWLYGITFNVVRALLRKQARELARRLPEAEAANLAVERVDPVELESAVRLGRQILAALSPKKRDVFVLAELEGHSTGEIAQQLGIKEATVGSRLHYARHEVNEKLRRGLNRR